MADFNSAYAKTARAESGYSNNPADNGGETWNGISRKFHPKWVGWATVDAAKKQANFPKNLASNAQLAADEKVFYRTTFWDVMRLSQCPDQVVAEELYDTAVNMGVGKAVSFLQRALNTFNRNSELFKPDLSPDGGYGNLTHGALLAFYSKVEKSRQNILYKALNCLQGAEYIRLADGNASQRTFTQGWFINRVFQHYS